MAAFCSFQLLADIRVLGLDSSAESLISRCLSKAPILGSVWFLALYVGICSAIFFTSNQSYCTVHNSYLKTVKTKLKNQDLRLPDGSLTNRFCRIYSFRRNLDN